MYSNFPACKLLLLENYDNNIKYYYLLVVSHHTCHVGMYRTKQQKVLWEVDSIIMQGMSHYVLSFCVPVWLSCHVIETICFSHKFLYKYSKLYGLTCINFIHLQELTSKDLGLVEQGRSHLVNSLTHMERYGGLFWYWSSTLLEWRNNSSICIYLSW